LELYSKWLSIDEIAKQRELTKQTIEWHIIWLYTYSKIPLNEVIKISTLEKLKFIKEFLLSTKTDTMKLWEIKTELNKENPDITYVDIKLALAMIDKKDL
jgi:uncharacterized protein YpbB